MPSFLFPVLIVVQVVAAFAVIILVMLQQGKGADMGSAFGGGSAGSVFGSAGASNFFSRMTKWAAVVFFATTLGLAYIGSKSVTTATPSGPDAGLMEQFSEIPVAPGAVAPAAPEANDAAVPSVGGAVEAVVEEAADAVADEVIPALGAPEVEEVPAAAQ